MTPEDQRIAIAKACGWTHLEDRSKNLMMAEGTYVFGDPPANAIVGKKEELPDYLNDLNAMYEAEKVLTESQTDDFVHKLIHSKIPCPDGTVEDWNLFEEYGWYGLLKATAAQRAEAFLKTLGLWKEDTFFSSDEQTSQLSTA